MMTPQQKLTANQIPVPCKVQAIEYAQPQFEDWDDTHRTKVPVNPEGGGGDEEKGEGEGGAVSRGPSGGLLPETVAAGGDGTVHLVANGGLLVLVSPRDRGHRAKRVARRARRPSTAREGRAARRRTLRPGLPRPRRK